MTKYISFLFALFLFSCGTKQTTETQKPQIEPEEPVLEKIYATINEEGHLVGVADKECFMQEPFKVWFSDDFDNYFPDPTIIEQIKPLLTDAITIKAFMGTWCGDSRREVPHFYKILETAGFNFDNLTMITVNHDKKSPRNEQEGLKLYYVPTFIFFKDGVEINRFVEYPQDSLEGDILKILKEEGYKNSYYEG